MTNAPRVMVQWVDGRRAVVGRVSQGVRVIGGRSAAVYYAEAVGLPSDPCDRFACACRKVEEALARARVRATRVG